MEQSQPQKGRIKIVPVAILLLIIAGLAYWFLVPAKSYANLNLNYFGLNGNVKSVTEKFYQPEKEFGKWVASSKLSPHISYENDDAISLAEYAWSYDYIKYHFDENGVLISKEWFFRGDDLVRKSTYHYEDGFLQEIKIFDTGGKHLILISSEHLSDNESIRKKVALDGFLTREVREQLNNGKPELLEVKFYNRQTAYSHSNINRIYNSQGFIDSYTVKDVPKGTKKPINLFFKRNYLKFDEEGNWIEAAEIEYSEGESIDLNSQPNAFIKRDITYY